MAAKSKKKRSTGQAAKKSTTRKSTAKKKTGNSEEQSFVGAEIVIWTTLAVSILILISNFGFGGSVGERAASFLAGIFGVVSYLFPFLLFGIVAFLVSNIGDSRAYVRTAAVIALTVLVCTFCELISGSGGSVGAALADALTPAIGVVGTYVVVLICMVICVVVITGKSALKGVKRQSGKAYMRAKDDAARRRAMAEEKRRERGVRENQTDGREKNRRSDRHVSGVSFDTTLKKKSPDMRELEIRRSDPPFAEDIPADAFEEIAGAGISSDGMEENLQRTAQTGSAEWMPGSAEPESAEKIKKTGRAGKKKLSGEETEQEAAGVAAAIAANGAKPKKAYRLPPLNLLRRGSKGGGESDAALRETAMKLQQTLQNFGVNVTVTNVSCGPSVTRYELQPEMGVKVSRIVGLADDIKLNLAAEDIRIEAPIPGKAAVGIEVPNKENSAVMLRDLLETAEFQNSASKISFAVGKDIAGKTVVTDIAKMPHLLIAGATGSGKSVCINTLIMSILYKADPDEVKLIMVDPKVVELSVYNGIPHLLIPVVTDPKKAAGALNWAVAEMTRRYQAFAEHNVRDMAGYNKKIKAEPEIDGEKQEPMPQIVIIVDELADLMMVASGEVEEAICRLAQLARAAGIHLVIATQRPSVNVITGLIKANMPSRIAFAVSSGVDSRTIIDMNGAEKLLGKGDMLFYPANYPKPARVQGSFVTDQEVQKVVDYLRDHNENTDYDEEIVQQVTASEPGSPMASGSDDNDRDSYFVDAGRLIIDKDKASIGMLQRMFKIGFNRAARIMDQLCEAGVVGGEEGTKPRKILMSPEEFEQYVQNM